MNRIARSVRGLSRVNYCLPSIFPLEQQQQPQSSNLFQRNIIRCHGDYPKEEKLTIKWILKDGSEKITPAAVGASLLQVAHRYDIELEGACAGVCACSTCHILLTRDVYESLPEASEEEEDMLDQAPGLSATSRLGCQVILTEESNNITVKLPKITRNFYVVSPSLVSISIPILTILV